MEIVLTFVIQLIFAFAAYWAFDSTSLDVPQKFRVFWDKPRMPTINDIEVNINDLDEYAIKKLYRDYEEDILSPAREYFALHKELSDEQGSDDSLFAHFFYAELFFFVASFSIASYWGIFSNIMAIAVAGLVYYKLTKLPLPQQHHDYNETYNYPDDFVPQYNGYISTAKKYGLSDADTVNYIAIKEHLWHLQILNHFDPVHGMVKAFRPLHKRHVGRIVLWTIALSITVISLVCQPNIRNEYEQSKSYKSDTLKEQKENQPATKTVDEIMNELRNEQTLYRMQNDPIMKKVKSGNLEIMQAASIYISIANGTKSVEEFIPQRNEVMEKLLEKYHSSLE